MQKGDGGGEEKVGEGVFDEERVSKGEEEEELGSTLMMMRCREGKVPNILGFVGPSGSEGASIGHLHGGKRGT